MKIDCDPASFKEAYQEITGDEKLPSNFTINEIVDILCEHKFNASEYLYYLHNHNKPLYPNVIKFLDNLNNYKEHKKERKQKNREDLEWFGHQVASRFDVGYTPIEILDDKHLDCLKLFRYVLASIDNNEEYMSKYRKAAIFELKQMPELKSIVASIYGKEVLPC